VMTPRSSCPGGESTPLQGANLRLNYEINNVTDTALGNLARGDTIVLAQASATDRLGHFWKAEAGQFWRAPKASCEGIIAKQDIVCFKCGDPIPGRTPQTSTWKGVAILLTLLVIASIGFSAFVLSRG
jgi:hypothetical protein